MPGWEGARREWKGARVRWEREWWESVLDECDRASGRGDTGGLYRELRKLEKRGQKKAPTDTTLTKEDFKTHFEKVSHARFENTPEERQTNTISPLHKSDEHNFCHWLHCN